MLNTAMAIAAALFFAAAALAESPVPIRSGETITLTLSDSGLVVTNRTLAAPMSAFEWSALQQMQGVELPAGTQFAPPMPITGDEATVPRFALGEVRITFREVQADTQAPPSHADY
jgi:hypothetical protein